jgi:hypothetical protein
MRLIAPLLLIASLSYAQGRGGRGAAPPPPLPTGKAGAMVDITGYWEALITRDWRYRIMTPPKGDYQGLPLNAAGRAAADAWDPAKDEASGDQCRSYGAANLMRMPGRLHISWQDDQTLKLETDAGTQTRLFYFGTPPSEGGDWQGVSQASWESFPGVGRSPATATGSLKVVTTKLKPGYIRRNGVPYSANAVLTEYFDRTNEPNGESHLIVTTTVEDPAYLAQPYLTSTPFKKQADASGWNPSPCAAK